MLKNKKIVVLLLCLVILAQSATAMAASFPDVKKDNNSGWAYDYIMELANKGIIKGYDDGYYRPDNNVTYLETLSLLNGVMNPSRTEINDAVSKYRTFLVNNNTPEWAIEIAAVALGRGVVQETEYTRANQAKMIELGTKVSISRYDVAVFTARALELEPKSASTLTYKDAASINAAGAPLIAALIDTQVLHKDGRDGEFLPSTPIKRSEMAKMIKYAYDWTVTHPLKGLTGATETATGTVVSYNPIGEKNFLVYKPTSGSTNLSVLVNTNTKVTDRNNATVALKDIINYEGAGVTITFRTVGTEKIATEVKFTTDKAASDGEYTFKSYRTANSKYYITVADKSGKSAEYESRYTTAKNGNVNIFIQDIKPDAKLNLKFTSGIVTEVNLATAQTGEYEVTYINNSSSYNRSIEVRPVNGGSVRTYSVNSDTTIVKDATSARFEDIRVGDKVDITGRYRDTADRIVIYSGSTTSYGRYTFDYIRDKYSGSYYGTYDRIYVYNNDSKKWEDFDIDTDVYYRGTSKTSLRKNDQIELKFNNYGRVTEISLSRGYNNYYRGIPVNYKIVDRNLIFADASTGKYYSYPIYYIGNDVKITEDGYNRSINGLSEKGYARVSLDNNDKLLEINVETRPRTTTATGTVREVNVDSREQVVAVVIDFAGYGTNRGRETYYYPTISVWEQSEFKYLDTVRATFTEDGKIIHLETY